MAEITYSAKYRTPTPLRRWVKLKGVVGDGIITEMGCRYFCLVTGEMIYIPINSEVMFSREREIAIKSKIKEEAGR